jgi:Fe-S-cluster containining protein
MSITSQKRVILNPTTHKDHSFIGCAGCGAKCCASTLVYASLYDIAVTYKKFPIFFRVSEGTISLVLFFQYGQFQGQKCAYLKGEMCSVYTERPYACRAYPFAYNPNEKGAYSMDVDCPNIMSSNGGTKLFQNGVINPDIIDNFVSQNMIDATVLNLSDTGEFVTFCHQNNLLVPFLEIYSGFSDFQPDQQSKLFVIHPQRTALLRMKYKERFENESFVEGIKATVASMSNLAVLKAAGL